MNFCLIKLSSWDCYSQLHVAWNFVIFFAYEIMVKILANLTRPCGERCYSIQKLKPVIGKVYFSQCFGNKFLLSKFDLMKV